MIAVDKKWGHVATSPGWKMVHNKTFIKDNQDAYVLQKNKSQKMMGVLDGHGKKGQIISNVIKGMLESLFQHEEITPKALDHINSYLEEVPEAIKSGSTLCVAIIDQNNLTVFNVGDSSCCLVKENELKVVNRPHSFTDKKETQRVLQAGGHITPQGRLNGRLNISRAMGDFKYKAAGLIGRPDVYREPLGQWKWILVGSDGLFDYVDRTEIARLVNGKMKDQEKVFLLVNMAQKKWIEHTGAKYADDVTVLLSEL